MNVRRMLRQYMEFDNGPRNVVFAERQHHRLRLRFGDAQNWRLDFHAALKKLSTTERTLLLLVHGAGYQRREAASITGVATHTVERRVIAAEARLKQLLEEQAEAEAETNHRRRRCNGIDLHAVVTDASR